MTQSEEAAAALRSLNEANAKVAQNFDYPFSRHVIFGLMMGSLIAGQAADHQATLISCLVIVGTLLVQKWDRKRTGTWIHGFRRGRTRPVTIVLLALILALLVPAAYYGHRGIVWVPLILGAIAAAAGIGLSYWWQRVYLAELREGGRP